MKVNNIFTLTDADKVLVEDVARMVYCVDSKVPFNLDIREVYRLPDDTKIVTIFLDGVKHKVHNQSGAVHGIYMSYHIGEPLSLDTIFSLEITRYDYSKESLEYRSGKHHEWYLIDIGVSGTERIGAPIGGNIPLSCWFDGEFDDSRIGLKSPLDLAVRDMLMNYAVTQDVPVKYIELGNIRRYRHSKCKPGFIQKAFNYFKL